VDFLGCCPFKKELFFEKETNRRNAMRIKKRNYFGEKIRKKFLHKAYNCMLGFASIEGHRKDASD